MSLWRYVQELVLHLSEYKLMMWFPVHIVVLIITLQVNKKFHKFERVYRDCIKRTRDKTRIHCIPHDAPGT